MVKHEFKMEWEKGLMLILYAIRPLVWCYAIYLAVESLKYLQVTLPKELVVLGMFVWAICVFMFITRVDMIAEIPERMITDGRIK